MRFVEDQQFGLSEDRDAERQACFHAGGELARSFATGAGEADDVQDFFDPRAGSAGQACMDQQVVEGAQMSVQGWAVDAGSDSAQHGPILAVLRRAEYLDRAGVGRHEAEQDAEGGGLSCTVAPEQGVDSSRRHGEVEAVEDDSGPPA